MANLTRCSNNHFYDADKYRTCPYCERGVENKKTEELRTYNPAAEEIGETVGFFDDMPQQPVVGWLVAVEGAASGKDFRLCSGRNYIGRGRDMDVVLEGDQMVSRSKHAIIVFDPVSQKTLCQAGDSRELFYLNGNVVTDTVELKRGDVITIGKTVLKFVPFCGEYHSWSGTED